MPFKSTSQEKMFWARAKDSPKWRKMAKKWQEHTPSGKLPKHAHESTEDEDREIPPLTAVFVERKGHGRRD